MELNDKQLEALIREELKIRSGNLSDHELRRLHFLRIHGPIRDLSGIESASELNRLYIDSTLLSDISSLSHLSKLTTLQIFQTKVSDLYPISGLSNLKELILSEDQLIEIGRAR